MGIGIVYKNRDELDKALEAHQKALTIFREVGNPLGEARATGNIGVTYEERGDAEEALRLYEEALRIQVQIGHVTDEAIGRANIGLIYLSQNKATEALGMFKRVQAIYHKTGFKPPDPPNLEEIVTRLESETNTGEPVQSN